MTREDMLNKLHNIEPAVKLTALTSEGALECEYITKKGTNYEWISMDSPWPAIKITDLDNDKLAIIKEKLKNQSLTCNDLEGTQLLSMYDGHTDEPEENISSLNQSLLGLIDITLAEDNDFFVLCDTNSYEPTFRFFSDYKLFAQAFEEEFIHVSKRWEELSDVELLSWIERLKFRFEDIPFIEY